MTGIFRQLATTLGRISHGANQVATTAAITFFCAMLALTFLQVVARYVFFSPPSWTEEGARYCMVWMGLLGATVAYYHAQDPAIIQKKPKWLALPLQKLLKLICVATFLGPVLWYAPEFLERNVIRTAEATGINSALFAMIIPLFAALVLLHALSEFCDSLFEIPEPEKEMGDDIPYGA